MHRVHNLFPDDCRRPALAIATLAHLPFVPTENHTGNVFSCSTLLRCFTGETISLLTFYIVRSHHIRWWNAISNLQHRILEMKSWGRSPLFIVHRFYIESSRFITFIVMDLFFDSYSSSLRSLILSFQGDGRFVKLDTSIQAMLQIYCECLSIYGLKMQKYTGYIECT